MAIDYKTNQKYFKQVNLCFPIALIIVGALVTLIGLNTAFEAALVGLLIGGVGVGLVVLQTSGRPSDQDYDAQVHQALAGFKDKAMNKLGIDPDDVQYADPVVINGNDFLTQSLVKRGKDGRLRSSDHTATALFFTEHQIHAYKTQFSLTNERDRVRDEEDEFFYSDLANVNITTDNPPTVRIVNEKNPPDDLTLQVLQVKTTGGIGLRAVFSTEAEGEAQKAVKAARTLIREKKIQN